MDLTHCDREPIHVPGSIQPHGLLLLFDWRTEVVKQFAGNPDAFLTGCSNPLGMTAAQLFGSSIKSASDARFGPGDEPIPLPGLVPDRPDLGATAHRRGDTLILEIEAGMDAEPVAAALLYELSRDAIAIQRAGERDRACEAAAHAIARQTGFDRVMVYQFLPDGSGKVVAECLGGSLGSLLNQHFPASDIPKQARDLYRRNLIRVIADVSYVPSPLVPGDSADVPLDMTDCALRSVSPVHVQYLRNMGVGASLSVSIMQDDVLWGLIACHHPVPRLVPYEAREASKQIGTVLGLQLQHLSASKQAEKVGRLAASRENLIALLSKLGVREELPGRLDQLSQLIESDGLIFAAGGSLETTGDAPSSDECRALVDWIRSVRTGKILVSNSLAEQFGRAAGYREQVSGILAIAIEDDEPIDLIWLRREYARVTLWAGNPHKEAGPGGELNPRNSFEVWREEIGGQSLPWDEIEKEAAASFQERLEAICARQRMVALQAELIFVSRVSAMGAMAATLAHELNQPLTAISNYASGVGRALEAGQDNPDLLKTGVNAIQANAMRAGEIIRSLREMIKREDVARTPQDLEPIVQQALTLVRSGEARCRSAVVDCDFSHEDRLVLADPVQIQQVIVNLVRNACDAYASGEQPRITIGTAYGGDFVRIEVSDDGPGIPESLQDSLFDAFSSTKADGLGVGLSICRTIVEAHGGRIDAANRPAGGASFSFTIPAFQP